MERHLKGTVTWDLYGYFWLEWIYLGLNRNRFWFFSWFFENVLQQRKKAPYLSSAAMDIILFGHGKILLLGIWPSSSCTYLFPLGKIPIIHSRILRKQLTRFYQAKIYTCHQTKLFIHDWFYMLEQAQREFPVVNRIVHPAQQSFWERFSSKTP